MNPISTRWRRVGRYLSLFVCLVTVSLWAASFMWTAGLNSFDCSFILRGGEGRAIGPGIMARGYLSRHGRCWVVGNEVISGTVFSLPTAEGPTKPAAGSARQSEWSVSIPLWPPFAVAFVCYIYFRWRDRKEAPPGHCPECWYNLTGLQSEVCPECGEEIKTQRPATREGWL